MIIAIVDNEFCCGENTGAWTWNAIATAGMDDQQGGGVLASLSNKDLVSILLSDNKDENTVMLTEEGEEIYEQLTGEKC